MKRYLGFIAVLIMAFGLSLNVVAAEGEAKNGLTVAEQSSDVSRTQNTGFAGVSGLKNSVSGEIENDVKKVYKLNIGSEDKGIQFKLTSTVKSLIELTLYNSQNEVQKLNKNSKSDADYYGAGCEEDTYYLVVSNTSKVEIDPIEYTIEVQALNEITACDATIPSFLKKGKKESTDSILTSNFQYMSGSNNSGDKISYRTDNPEIVSVDEVGNLSGNSAGTTTVSVTNLAGKILATKEITVCDENDALTVGSQKKITLNNGKAVILLNADPKKTLYIETENETKIVEYRNSYGNSSKEFGSYYSGGKQISIESGPAGESYLEFSNATAKEINVAVYDNIKDCKSIEELSLPVMETKEAPLNSQSLMTRILYKVNCDGNYKFRAQQLNGDKTRYYNVIDLYDTNFNIIKSDAFKIDKDQQTREETYNNLPQGEYYLLLQYINRIVNEDTVKYKLNAFKIPDNPITSIEITDIPKLTVGNTHKITYKTAPETTDDVVLFESSDEAVATVTKEGVITAVGVGKVTITARNSAGDVVGTSEVTVEEAQAPNPSDPTVPEQPSNPQTPDTTVKPETGNKETKVKALKITGASHVLAVGKKRQLKVKVTPKNANTAVVWRSSNKKYATVNKNGKVFAKRAGRGKKVVITAIAKDGSGVKATYKIRIAKGIVKKVKITGSKTVKAGKTVKLKAKVTGTKGCYKKVKWKSSNEKLATVTPDGKVKFTKKAKNKKVKITAKALDGSGKKAVYNYIVR